MAKDKISSEEDPEVYGLFLQASDLLDSVQEVNEDIVDRRLFIAATHIETAMLWLFYAFTGRVDVAYGVEFEDPEEGA